MSSFLAPADRRQSLKSQTLSIRSRTLTSSGKFSLKSNSSGVRNTRNRIGKFSGSGYDDDDLKGKNMMKFVYSEAVERAFRRRYQCSFFGPFSAHVNPAEPGTEILKLPEIYSDFVLIKELLENNHRYVDTLQRELGDSYINALERSGTLPRLHHQKSSHKTRQKQAESSVTKLPSLGGSPEHTRSTTSMKTGRS